MQGHPYRQFAFRVALGSIVAMITPLTSLQAAGLGLRAGTGDQYQRLELAWESPTFWSHAFAGSDSHLDLVAELGGAYWQAAGGRKPDNVWQFGATPFLRWTLQGHFYLEAGVGPTLFTRTTFADEDLSTAFQIGSHLGLGAQLSGHDRLGVRVSHFSNADIKMPNPGLNVIQLSYTHSY